MLWSIPVARIAGTVVRVHVTFVLFLVWIGGSQWRLGGRDAAFDGVLFMLLLFGCVLAHEFGHVLAARRYGIRTPEVTLGPIGGIASLERIPEKPGEELVVALAGPAVNLVIAAVLIFVLGAGLEGGSMADLENARAGILARSPPQTSFSWSSILSRRFPWTGGACFEPCLPCA
ncbi:MAG: hypothetical protein K0Q64_648 [Nitrobacter vulgaris]|nr:hypothetical protein [Nitrobacter vulgaris]